MVTKLTDLKRVEEIIAWAFDDLDKMRALNTYTVKEASKLAAMHIQRLPETLSQNDLRHYAHDILSAFGLSDGRRPHDNIVSSKKP